MGCGENKTTIRRLTRGLGDVDMVMSLDDELARVCVRGLHEDKSQVCNVHDMVSPL